MYNDYFIDKAKFLSDDSLVMAKRAVLKEINDKPNSDSGFSFRTSTRFHLKIPLSFSHVNHSVRDLSTIGQYVDKRVDPSDENQITCVALKNPESYKYNFIRSETINK